jgi:hypothetical protein
MKDWFASLGAGFIKMVVAFVVAIASAIVTAQAWVKDEIATTKEEILQIRNIDMNHLDKRLDEIHNDIRAIRDAR